MKPIEKSQQNASMAQERKEYAFVASVIFDSPSQKKWLSVRFPIEETQVGDKFRVAFRPKGTDEEWRQTVSTVYFERFKDGHILDIDMEFPGVNVDDEYDVIATKL